MQKLCCKSEKKVQVATSGFKWIFTATVQENNDILILL